MLVDPENPRPDDHDFVPHDVPRTTTHPTSITTRRRRAPIEKNPPGCEGCARGWIGEDAEGHPVPCPTCRPTAAARAALRPSEDVPTMSIGAQRHQRVIDDLRRERAAHHATVTQAVDLAVALAQAAVEGAERARGGVAPTIDPHAVLAASSNAVAARALDQLHRIYDLTRTPVDGCPYCAPYLPASTASAS